MSPSPEIRYYPAGQGWWGYQIYLNGRAVQGAEFRTRKDAIRDAQATLRRLAAEITRRTG